VLAHVGSNTFIYYKQFDSSKRIAPDIYVLPGIAPEQISRSWKLWEIQAPPSFALEVVSLDVDKDYAVAPAIHDEIGTKELVIFDPERRGPERQLWHSFQRHASGELRLVVRSNADRIASPLLGCHLRVVGKGDAQRLRLGTGARGDVLFPTPAEEAKAERAARLAAESAGVAAESRCLAAESARVAAEAANAELRAEIERLRAPKRSPRKR
jgi:Putative restriction endonuclease